MCSSEMYLSIPGISTREATLLQLGQKYDTSKRIHTLVQDGPWIQTDELCGIHSVIDVMLQILLY